MLLCRWHACRTIHQKLFARRLELAEQARDVRLALHHAADVSRVAWKYLHKENLAVLVVGNAEEFGTPLSKLGQVKDVDITIPLPPASLMGEAAGPGGN